MCYYGTVTRLLEISESDIAKDLASRLSLHRIVGCSPTVGIKYK